MSQRLRTAQELNALYRDMLALDMPADLVRSVVLVAAQILMSDGIYASPENTITPASWTPKP